MIDRPKTITKMLRDAATNDPEHVELHERTARDIEMNHEYLIDALDRIITEATELRKGLKSDGADAFNMAARISEGAGASGPIGSQWSKALKHATAVVVLGQSCYGRGA